MTTDFRLHSAQIILSLRESALHLIVSTDLDQHLSLLVKQGSGIHEVFLTCYQATTPLVTFSVKETLQMVVPLSNCDPGTTVPSFGAIISLLDLSVSSHSDTVSSDSEEYSSSQVQ